jgi:aspartyl-tRNA(Asn)/glutamyl-tRNA(Gln) amidotransferase subunit C
MALTKEQVLHVAALARLRLTEDEVDRLVTDLGNILNHVDQLSQLDTSDVPPTEHVAVVSLPLQADEPNPGLDTEAALKPAPRVVNGGFAVPAFVDDN